MDNCSNVSDHHAVMMQIPDDGNSMTDSRRYRKPVVTKVYRWEKGDRSLYYADTGDLLSKIVHAFTCAGTNSICDNVSHCHDIEIYYHELCTVLHLQLSIVFPKYQTQHLNIIGPLLEMILSRTMLMPTIYGSLLVVPDLVQYFI